MPRFDVHLLGGQPKKYVVDVQSDFLSHLDTRIVIPLLPQAKVEQQLSDLNPVFEFAGEQLVLITSEVTAIARRHLPRSIGSLAAQRDEITRALDILLTGF